MKPFLDMTNKTAVLNYLRSRSLIWPEVEGGCFEWMQYTTPDGYGRFTANGIQYYVHREGLKASGGFIPEGMTVDHWCRNRACWNPAHLDVVSREENTRRARNAYWARFTMENRAALNLSQKMAGSVIAVAA
ncbi:HNH endonuclease signature motif containing protein [Streptomyces sp. NPDC048291]|uniref:HNH endonuclease signature motif containing protein n=1 Tax=Streptomyces sp. NPDC048291 TaxID=3365530 RepID=UPI003710722A